MNLAHYNYTEQETKQIIQSMTILVDKQEKANAHIIAWLDKNKVKHEQKSLDFGDYTFKLGALPEMTKEEYLEKYPYNGSLPMINIT